MKTQLFKLSQSVRKINSQHIQFALLLVALVALILGSGAPADGIVGVH